MPCMSESIVCAVLLHFNYQVVLPVDSCGDEGAYSNQWMTPPHHGQVCLYLAWVVVHCTLFTMLLVLSNLLHYSIQQMSVQTK